MHYDIVYNIIWYGIVTYVCVCNILFTQFVP